MIKFQSGGINFNFSSTLSLVKSVFGAPASSATSERIFSELGRVLGKRKQSMNPDNVDDILMIRNFRNM